jgi:cyclic pyranopterin phosphate synthase
MTPLLDQFGRPLRSLRISVTDRCNLRCNYCMPEEDYVWLPREEILSFEEIAALADVFLSLGVDKFRLTGGEPLLRRDLHVLVRALASRTAVRDLALTTNAVLLADQAAALASAGLRRVTISLDTLRPERFEMLTRRNDLSRVLGGIAAARAVGLSIKLNAVIVRRVNDDELPSLIDFARSVGAEVRFIEYMDVGGATRWSADQVVSQREMLDTLRRRFGDIQPLPGDPHAPAERFALSDGTRFGIIASTTAPFCGRCDRSRLTADGMWYLCLYATKGMDLRRAIRSGLAPDRIADLIAAAWRSRADRGAEQRLTERHRGPFVPLTVLRGDTHLEMHTRGG